MEKYKVLKDITFNDVLELEPGQFKDECIKRLIDCGFIEKRQRFYEMGQRFKHGRDVYILSRLDKDRVILINLEDGNSWRFRGCAVENDEKITETEFSEITGRENKFELVEK